MSIPDLAVVQLVRFQPFDPPGYQLFYTAILVLVMGAAGCLALQKIMGRKLIKAS